MYEEHVRDLRPDKDRRWGKYATPGTQSWGGTMNWYRRSRAMLGIPAEGNWPAPSSPRMAMAPQHATGIVRSRSDNPYYDTGMGDVAAGGGAGGALTQLWNSLTGNPLVFALGFAACYLWMSRK